jgi:hypothetical protein
MADHIWVWVQGFYDTPDMCAPDPNNCYAGLNGYWSFYFPVGSCTGGTGYCALNGEITREIQVCGYDRVRGRLTVQAFSNETPSYIAFTIEGYQGGFWFSLVGGQWDFGGGGAVCNSVKAADTKWYQGISCFVDDLVFNLVLCGP